VASWTNPGFPQDETGVVQSKAVLEKVVESLNLNPKWGRRWGKGVPMKPDAILELLKRFTVVNLIPLDQAGVIEVSAFGYNGGEAAELANSVAGAYRSYRNQARPVAEILDAAVPGQKPISESKPMLLVIGTVAAALLGLLAGTAASRLQAWRSRKCAVRA
jgi:uncharacterized protein involved in exopolysaccharide biosynthesis